METIITKSYQGAQTRLLLPKVKDVAGVIGDNNATRLVFKLPKIYATGWDKFVEFDCFVIRDEHEIRPVYTLDENNSILIPYEITEANVGKEVDYNLKLVSQDGEIVEKSEMGTLYFRDSTNGEYTEPEPHVDVLTFLYNNAFCNVSYSEDAEAPESGVTVPQLTFTPMNPSGEEEKLVLNIPYLDNEGHILNRFINKEIVVEIFKISSPSDLTGLTEAQVPDMALLSEGDDPTESYYMDLYMLVGNDPTDVDNWYLIHTDNPTFKNINATGNVDIAGTLDVGQNAQFDSNVEVTGETQSGSIVSESSIETQTLDVKQTSEFEGEATFDSNIIQDTNQSATLGSTTTQDIHATTLNTSGKATLDSLEVEGQSKFDGNVTIGTHSTGSPDTHATLTVNGDVHVDSDKKIFVDTIQSQTDGNPVTINDDVTLSSSKTMKVDRIESSTGGNNFPVTINDDLAIGTSLNPKTLTSFDKITGKNGLDITSGVTNLQNTNIGSTGAGNEKDLHVYGDTVLEGSLNIDDNVFISGNVDVGGAVKTDTITPHTPNNNIAVESNVELAAGKNIIADSTITDTISSRSSTSGAPVTVNDNLAVTGNIQQTGNNTTASLNATTIAGTLGVSDATTLDSLTVTNASSLNTVTASGEVDLEDKLKVDLIESHTSNNHVVVCDELDVGTTQSNKSLKVYGSADITGNTVLEGDATIGTQGESNSLTVNGTITGGDTSIGALTTPSITTGSNDPLQITGDVSISNDLSVASDLTVTDDVTLSKQTGNSILTTDANSSVSSLSIDSENKVLTAGSNQTLGWQTPSGDLTEQNGVHIASTGGLYTLQTTKAPNDHADTTMKYGHATPSKYGHVKFDQTVASNRQTYSPIGALSSYDAYVGYYIADVTQPSGYKKITEDNKTTSGIVLNTTVAYLNDTSLMTISEEGIRDFVNSSIGTATANFLGTFRAKDDADPTAVPPKTTSIYSFGWTQAKVDTMVDPYSSASEEIKTALANKMVALSITPSPNDYVFVEMDFTTPTTSPDEYRRYKFNESTGWEYEYTLNNSSFTEAQWNAIDSGITALKVSKLNGLPNYAPSMPTAQGPIGGDLKPVYVDSSGQITEVANNLVTTANTDQNIAGKKTFTGQIWAQNTIRLAPASNIRRGLAFLVSGTSTEETVIGKTSNGDTVKYLLGEPTTAGLNDGTIPSIGYINDYQKATYLVHRSGEETIADHKTFTGAVDIKNVLTIGSQTVNGSIELYHATPFIDFHYNKTTADYTSRIIESSAGTLSIGTTDGTNSANLTLFGNQSTAHLRGSYRATPSADTEILTLGNGVSLSTDQTITAFKTFTKGITCKNTNVPSSSTIPSINSQTRVIFNANDDSRIMTFDSWCYTGGTTSVNISNETTRNSLTPRPQISLNVSATGVGYIQALNQRAYDASNISDIVTIGMLKNATAPININGSSLYNKKCVVGQTSDVASLTGPISWYKVASTTISAGYTDTTTKFRVWVGFGGETITNSGLLTAHLRSQATSATISSHFIWESALYGITPSSYVLLVKAGDSSNPAVLEIWTKVTTPYQRKFFEQLVEGNISAFTNQWELFNNAYTGETESQGLRYTNTGFETYITNNSFTRIESVTGTYLGSGMQLTSTSPWLQITKTNLSRSYAGYTQAGGMQISCNDGIIGGLYSLRSTPLGSASSGMYMYSNNATGGQKTLTLWSRDDGTGYLETTAYDETPVGLTSVLTAGNGVTLKTAQTITGAKTFSGSAITVSKNSSNIILKNPNYTRESLPSSNTTVGIDFIADDGSYVGYQQVGIKPTGDGFYTFITRNHTKDTIGSLTINAVPSGSYTESSYRPYSSTENRDVLVKAHVADMMTANVSNHPVKIYSAQNNLISTTTLNQFVDQDITLPASSVQYQNVTFGGSSPTTGTTAFTLQSTPDYANYPYRASYALTGVTADTYVSVTFSDAQVDSGNFASFAKTVDGYVYLYANADVGATTVPTISLGMDDTAAAGLATSALDGKVNKLETTGRKVYTHDGTTQGELTYSENYVGNSIAYRDANGRMAVADPVSGSTNQTVATTNWISQTGDSAPNNLVHRTGNESVAGVKKIQRTVTNLGSNVRITGTSKMELFRFTFVASVTTTIRVLYADRGITDVFSIAVSTDETKPTAITITPTFQTNVPVVWAYILNGEVIVAGGNNSSRNYIYSWTPLLSFYGAAVATVIDMNNSGRLVTSEIPADAVSTVTT